MWHLVDWSEGSAQRLAGSRCSGLTIITIIIKILIVPSVTKRGTGLDRERN